MINGVARAVPDGLTVATLIEHLGVKSDRVAVELNREIVPRNRWDTTNLGENDRLEIVHFVGGGAPLPTLPAKNAGKGGAPSIHGVWRSRALRRFLI